MFSTRALRIEVHRRGEVSALEVQEEGALIGSGSHCDVRLAPDEAAVEQLFVEIVGDDVFARAKAVSPACRVNGAPFLAGKVANSAMIEIGATAIHAQIIDRKQGTEDGRGEGKASSSPLMQALGLIAVALGLYAVLSADKGSVVALAAVNPPGVRALPQQPCAQQEPQAARALALQLRMEAEIKRERAPFHPRDALAGAPLFARAADCFTRAGDADSAHSARGAALALEAQVADQLRRAHVRIERSLEDKSFEDARRNAELALTLVPDADGAYVQWLLSVKRVSAVQRQSGGKKW